MTESHNAQITIEPVIHGEVSSHNGALHMIIVEKDWAKISYWNGFDAKDIQDRGAYNETGIFFGFSVVKSYSERGHLFAFTSATLNKYACADPKPQGEVSGVAALKAKLNAAATTGVGKGET